MKKTINIIITIILSMAIAWFICKINPAETYTWRFGMWHGLFFVPNLLLSLFTDALFKAPNATTAYNVWWWIFTIFGCISFLGKLMSGGGSAAKAESKTDEKAAEKPAAAGEASDNETDNNSETSEKE